MVSQRPADSLIIIVSQKYQYRLKWLLFDLDLKNVVFFFFHFVNSLPHFRYCW